MRRGIITGTIVFAQRLRREGGETFMLFTRPPIAGLARRNPEVAIGRGFSLVVA